MPSAFAKSMLLVAGAGGAALLLVKRSSSSSKPAAPLGANATPRPPPASDTVAQVASDAGAVLNLAQQAKGFFDSLPSWGSSDGAPAIAADDPSNTYT